MRAIRALAQAAIGVLSLLIGALLLPADDFAGTLAAIALLLIGVTLLIGPWWPKNKWQLRLPTDDPRIANPLLCAFMAVFGFYRAWDAYVDPGHEFVRLEKTIFALLGRDGVAAFWIVLASVCLAGSITLLMRYGATRGEH